MSTFSEIKITFSQDLSIGAQFGFNIATSGNPFGGIPFAFNAIWNWVNPRVNSYLVSTGIPTAIPGERAAINFVIAFNLDLSGYTVTRIGNEVTIRVENLYGTTTFSWGPILYDWDFLGGNGLVVTCVSDPSVTVVIHNETTSFRFDSVVLSSAPTPCTHVRITAQTNIKIGRAHV